MKRLGLFQSLLIWQLSFRLWSSSFPFQPMIIDPEREREKWKTADADDAIYGYCKLRKHRSKVRRRDTVQWLPAGFRHHMFVQCLSDNAKSSISPIRRLIDMADNGLRSTTLLSSSDNHCTAMQFLQSRESTRPDSEPHHVANQDFPNV